MTVSITSPSNLSGYVPYTGATSAVDLGTNYITASSYNFSQDLLNNLTLNTTVASYDTLVVQGKTYIKLSVGMGAMEALFGANKITNSRGEWDFDDDNLKTTGTVTSGKVTSTVYGDSGNFIDVIYASGNDTIGGGNCIAVENIATAGQPIAGFRMALGGNPYGTFFGCSTAIPGYCIVKGVNFATGSLDSNQDIGFRTVLGNGWGTGPQMIIKGDTGKVGIATSAPATALDVSGQLTISAASPTSSAMIFTGYSIGGATGTGVYFGLNVNIANNKQFMIGDLDYLNTSNSSFIRFVSVSGYTTLDAVSGDNGTRQPLQFNTGIKVAPYGTNWVNIGSSGVPYAQIELNAASGGSTGNVGGATFGLRYVDGNDNNIIVGKTDTRNVGFYTLYPTTGYKVDINGGLYLQGDSMITTNKKWQFRGTASYLYSSASNVLDLVSPTVAVTGNFSVSGNLSSGGGLFGSTAVQDIVITGTPTPDYKGTYRVNGTYNGKNSYKIIGGTTGYIWWGSGYWFVSGAVGTQSNDFFLSSSETLPPESSGWTPQLGASGTLTTANKTGTYIANGRYALFGDKTSLYTELHVDGYEAKFSDGTDIVTLIDGSYAINSEGDNQFTESQTNIYGELDVYPKTSDNSGGGIYSTTSAGWVFSTMGAAATSIGAAYAADSTNSVLLCDDTYAINSYGPIIHDNIKTGSGAPATILTTHEMYVDQTTGIVYIE